MGNSIVHCCHVPGRVSHLRSLSSCFMHGVIFVLQRQLFVDITCQEMIMDLMKIHLALGISFCIPGIFKWQCK